MSAGTCTPQHTWGGVREQISGAVLSLHLGEPGPLLLLCVLQATCLTERPSDSVSPPISLTAGVLGLQRWPHLAFYRGLRGPELRFVQQALYLLSQGSLPRQLYSRLAEEPALYSPEARVLSLVFNKDLWDPSTNRHIVFTGLSPLVSHGLGMEGGFSTILPLMMLRKNGSVRSQ